MKTIINNEVVFKTKIAVTSEEKINENLHLENLGISSSIEDSDIKYVNAWIKFNKIVMVEDVNEGYNIYLTTGDTVFSKENPFDV